MTFEVKEAQIASFEIMKSTLLSLEDAEVHQQMVIELLMGWHAARMDDEEQRSGTSDFVIDAMAKHAKQMITKPP